MNEMLLDLQQRQSTPADLLGDPAPDDNQIAEIIKAGMAAPDHARLKPWRFIVIRGEARQKLGDLFVEATSRREPDMPADKLEKQRGKPLRSPLIIASVATITEDHPKTPVVEQILSAGAATQLMQLAATALGFGSIWLTGPNAADDSVKSALGIKPGDELVGFLYIGTARNKKPPADQAKLADHVSYWNG